MSAPRRWQINGMVFECERRTLALRKMGTQGRVWLDNGQTGESPWQLRVADAKGRIVNLDASMAGAAKACLQNGALHLSWRNVRCAKSGAGPFDVDIEIKAAAPKNMTAWRLTVRNRSSAWTIWHMVFPRLRGLVPGRRPQDDTVFWPEMWGRHTTGWNNMADATGNCGGYGKHSMQFMGFTSSGRTLYFGAHDPWHWQKMMSFNPGKAGDTPRRGAMHFLLYPSGMTEAGNCYEQRYDIMVGELAGDWVEASKFYAAFARQQTWANMPPPGSFRGRREDREILIWEQATINPFPSDRMETVNNIPAAKWLAAMKSLQRRLDVRMAVHFYCWHQTPFDTNYPEYFPAKRGFKELAAALKDAGIVAMPYINGRLWDQAAASYGPEAERAAEKISAQRVAPKIRYAWPENYGNGQLLTGMCMHTVYWRKTVVGLCRRIIRELGCSGVYLDQLGCFGGRVCVDPRHGHPLGGGDYWHRGMRRLLAEVRAAIGPEPVLTTENNWEGCVADFDALLDTQWNHDDNLPIFPAVYWGQGVIYGGNVFADAYEGDGDAFIQRMGMRCVWGGVLGWGHFEHLLARKNADILAYFIRLCRLRKEYGRFFCRGEFLRPPAISVDGRKCVGALSGPALAAIWQDPDGNGAALFAVNVTRRQVKADLHLGDAGWRVGQIDQGTGKPDVKVAARTRGSISVWLAPLAAAAIRLLPT